MFSPKHQSILVIGASGRSGIEIMRYLSKHPSKPEVHAFCRDPNKLCYQGGHHICCNTVVKGDARSAPDIESALSKTHAAIVIVSIGNGDDVSKTDIRTASAVALVQVLTSKPEFSDVQVVVVSSTGAGTSSIKIGMGVGKLIEYHLRHILRDHSGQEAAFAEIKDRTMIVRATALTDSKPTGNIKMFGDTAKSPTIHIDRADLAEWIVKQICEKSDNVRGRVVNITGVKRC